MLKRGDMEDKGLDMHGLHHEQWNRDRVPGFERLQWKRDVYVASDRRSCPCSDRRSGDEAAETAAETSGDTLHVGYQHDVQEFQQAMQRKRDGRPFLCKAGRVSFYGPKEAPICCERCVSAARSLSGWLFEGCKTVDETPGAYDDTTPPPITQQGATRDTTPRPCLCPSVDCTRCVSRCVSAISLGDGARVQDEYEKHGRVTNMQKKLTEVSYIVI